MIWPIITLCVTVVCGIAVFLARQRARQLEMLLEFERQAARDATREKLNALKQENAKRQTLFDRMLEGVLLLDAVGRIEFVNLALKRLWGLRANIEGLTLKEALFRTELEQLVAQALEEGQVVGGELEFSEVTPRWLQVNASTFPDSQERPLGVLLVFHDLTRSKQLEITRKEFVANVSHELRTPLSLIKGFTETLLHGGMDDPVNAMRFLRSIDKHADRLTFLIEDLLVLSRLESGQILLNLQTIDLRELTNRVIEDLEGRAKEKETRLDNRVEEGFLIRGDSERLQQVLFNLIENAIKYGKMGGSVTLLARELADGRAEVCVQDDGQGIPSEARERVFERFYRVDRARARDTGGTGLGLSIVKHIVQAHEGEVWVQSAPGVGSAFYFTIDRSVG